MTTSLKLGIPWEEVKQKLLESEPFLTDEDLEYSKGQEEELLERLAKKMDRSPEHVRGWIESVAFTDGRAG